MAPQRSSLVKGGSNGDPPKILLRRPLHPTNLTKSTTNPWIPALNSSTPQKIPIPNRPARDVRRARPQCGDRATEKKIRFSGTAEGLIGASIPLLEADFPTCPQVAQVCNFSSLPRSYADAVRYSQFPIQYWDERGCASPSAEVFSPTSCSGRKVQFVDRPNITFFIKGSVPADIFLSGRPNASCKAPSRRNTPRPCLK